MNSSYSMEELVKTFNKHAIESEKNNQELIQSFKENNPGEELPSHFKSDFNICIAFSAICSEILNLKEKYDKNHNQS